MQALKALPTRGRGKSRNMWTARTIETLSVRRQRQGALFSFPKMQRAASRLNSILSRRALLGHRIQFLLEPMSAGEHDRCSEFELAQCQCMKFCMLPPTQVQRRREGRVLDLGGGMYPLLPPSKTPGKRKNLQKNMQIEKKKNVWYKLQKDAQIEEMKKQ